MSKPRTIAIDGPVAAGKDTVGRAVAERLGYRFLDTGVMYRALTWLALKEGVRLEDEEALGQLAAAADISIGDNSGDSPASVLVNREDVTHSLRSAELERGVSLVARVGPVREALVARQQEMAREGRVVMAGRDIGTVVVPDAELKVYLAASPEERARRRLLQLRGQGQKASYQGVLADLERRDRIDSQRALSPLRPAPEALIIDTDGLDVGQVVAWIMARVEER